MTRVNYLSDGFILATGSGSDAGTKNCRTEGGCNPSPLLEKGRRLRLEGFNWLVNADWERLDY
jgi:hypothetical protein